MSAAKASASGGPIRTMLFDAGGVLLDLDYAYLKRLIAAQRVDVSVDTLAAEEARARTAIHARVQQGEYGPALWRDYFHAILGRVGVPASAQAAVIDALWEAHQRHGLWTRAIEGTVDVVRDLKSQGVQIAVVSNAEGQVQRDLDQAGYGGLFETVVDSHLVGVSKPDPKIFHIALERIGAQADSTGFIGDVPSIDVAGARAAGLRPVLLDRHDVYPDEPVDRLRSIDQLGGWIAAQS